jgi:hypothetical protein
LTAPENSTRKQAAFDSNNNRRWQNAIVRAKQIAESNPFVSLQSDGKLIVLSDSNEIYEVTDGQCATTEGEPCKAFSQGQPCKHRALRRLILRYNEVSH